MMMKNKTIPALPASNFNNRPMVYYSGYNIKPLCLSKKSKVFNEIA